MNILIIGAGNMGGAIARALCCVKNGTHRVTVVDLSETILKELSDTYPQTLQTSTSALSEIANNELILLAVKPWLISTLLEEIRDQLNPEKHLLASIAAGISCEQLQTLGQFSGPTFRVVPNTAIQFNQSMTFIATRNASSAQTEEIEKLFSLFGKAETVTEKEIPALTALTSCGLAYALRYIRAATEGAVELGVYPGKATEYILQTLQGAIALLDQPGKHPESEIDKITTPGGITIQGLNAMEKEGFTKAVIEGLKKSCIR